MGILTTQLLTQDTSQSSVGRAELHEVEFNGKLYKILAGDEGDLWNQRCVS